MKPSILPAGRRKEVQTRRGICRETCSCTAPTTLQWGEKVRWTFRTKRTTQHPGVTTFPSELVGLIFHTSSLVLQIPSPGLLSSSKVSCTIRMPWDTCRVTTIGLAAGLDMLWTGSISARTHHNASLSRAGKQWERAGNAPQDALPGLSHLLRLKEGKN